MEHVEPVIEPDEVRAIRKKLDLSQVEAGELLGGGPRAFAKYEAGSIKPRASVVRLLRLLDQDPAAIASLTGRERPPASASHTLPLEVTGELIALQTEHTFPKLLCRLLSAEAQTFGLPEHGIHVGGNITAPDGGEDGRIRWSDGPSCTSFLPSRFSQFQLKAGPITPAAAGRDVVDRNGEAKPMVRAALEAGGHYIMLCARQYTHQQIDSRENKIRTALRSAGIEFDDSQVDFRDADQIALWVNRYPSVAAWVKQWAQPGTIGPFRAWTHWASRAEHDTSPRADDDRLPGLREPVRESLAEPRRVVRVVGPSGIGKSRLVLEALERTEEDERLGYSLTDLVLYADESEAGGFAINEVVQTLAEHGQRAVMVVDRCPPESHRTLVGMVQRQGSHLSLITIDDQIPRDARDGMFVDVTAHETLVKVSEAPASVTEAIINAVCPGLPSEDFRRLAHFSRGFPKIAHLVAQAWTSARPVAHSTDEHLVETFILGRRSHDRDLLLGSAQLLSAFRLVTVDHPDRDELSEVAARGRNLSGPDLRNGFNQLIDRGVARRRGNCVTLQPRPIALHLAERKWRDWGRDGWDEILGGNTSPELKASAAKQLALLNTTDIAQQVVQHVCRVGGPFDNLEGIVQPCHAAVLSTLAEIDPSVVAERIGRFLRCFPDLDKVRGNVRRELVWALEKIAFHPDSFDAGAHQLLLLALAENEAYGNNATGQFASLFPVILGNTAADGCARLLFLKEAARSDDPAQQKIVVDALVKGTATGHFSRSVGPETHGARPTLSSWYPATRDEARSYIQGCLNLLAAFAAGDGEVADAACAGLGRNLGSLASSGFVDLVEAGVRRVAAVRDSWPEAREALDWFMRHERSKTEPETITRIRALLDELEPQDLDGRVRMLVTEMSWEYLWEEELDHDQLYSRQVEAVREFAAEVLLRPDTLLGLLPRLSRQLEPRDGRHPQRMLFPFGQAIAQFAEKPLDWLDPITETLGEVPANRMDFDLLSGYLDGIRKAHPAEVEAFKVRAAASDMLAPALPLVCWRLGIVASDIGLVLSALDEGRLSPWPLMQWTLGGVLARVEAPAVAPLFDTLLDHSDDGYAVAVQLIGMYAFGRQDLLENLRPQLRKAAENLARCATSPHRAMVEHHFGDLMKWLLEKGREDPDARAAALALARAPVGPNADSAEGMIAGRMTEEHMIKPVIRQLLSGFPEIVWPVLGQGIISGPIQSWHLGTILGGPVAPDKRDDAAILALPEDVMFEWCRAHPDSAPAFTATVLPVLTTYDRGAVEHALHPRMARLLEEFGDRDDVLRAISGNIHSYTVWGSPTAYFALYQATLSRLRDEHMSAKVRRWARETLRGIDDVCKGIRNEEEEREARHDV